MPKFPDRLKQLRRECGLSQQALADALKVVSKSSVNMYERGEREPGIEVLEAIADYFNVDLDYLIGKCDVKNRAIAQYPIHSDQEENVIRIAGRNGRYIERRLTDDQIAAFAAMLDQMPDVPDDL